MAEDIPLTLKLKNKRITVLLLVPATATIAEVQDQLAQTLNESHPQSIPDKPDSGLTDIIDIPVPSMETSDTSVVEEESIEEISSENIRLASPVDKSDYSKGWQEITDVSSTLKHLGIRDHSTFAYIYKDGEDFEVEVPVDDYE